MNRNALLLGAFSTFAAFNAMAATPATSASQDSAGTDALTGIVQKLDTELFDSFNHCDDPAQLKKHESYLDPNLEFYHDKGGVTWTRAAYIENTRRNVCGNFRRVLTAGSLQVYPIKDYGAIEEGHHMFCDIKSGKCFGEAKFLVIWHHSGNGWEATRIMSYGHEALH